MPEGSVFRDGRGAASRASIVFANNDFLSCGERRMPVWVTTLSNDNARFTSAERRVGVIILAMIALWLSEPLHGIHSSLCGERGVARVFGPQKGATPEQVAMLEQGLEHYASVIQRDIGLDVRLSPGSGASGGLGAGLHALLGATLHNRYAIVMQYLDLDRQLASADLVITAEGTIDGQTPYDKIPAAMTRRDQRYGIPVVVLAGAIGADADANYQYGITAFQSIVRGPCPIEDAIRDADALTAACAEGIMHLIQIGQKLANRQYLPGQRKRERMQTTLVL